MILGVLFVVFAVEGAYIRTNEALNQDRRNLRHPPDAPPLPCLVEVDGVSFDMSSVWLHPDGLPKVHVFIDPSSLMQQMTMTYCGTSDLDTPSPSVFTVWPLPWKRTKQSTGWFDASIHSIFNTGYSTELDVAMDIYITCGDTYKTSVNSEECYAEGFLCLVVMTIDRDTAPAFCSWLETLVPVITRRATGATFDMTAVWFNADGTLKQHSLKESVPWLAGPLRIDMYFGDSLESLSRAVPFSSSSDHRVDIGVSQWEIIEDGDTVVMRAGRVISEDLDVSEVSVILRCGDVYSISAEGCGDSYSNYAYSYTSALCPIVLTIDRVDAPDLCTWADSIPPTCTIEVESGAVIDISDAALYPDGSMKYYVFMKRAESDSNENQDDEFLPGTSFVFSFGCGRIADASAGDTSVLRAVGGRGVTIIDEDSPAIVVPAYIEATDLTIDVYVSCGDVYWTSQFSRASCGWYDFDEEVQLPACSVIMMLDRSAAPAFCQWLVSNAEGLDDDTTGLRKVRRV